MGEPVRVRVWQSERWDMRGGEIAPALNGPVKYSGQSVRKTTPTTTFVAPKHRRPKFELLKNLLWAGRGLALGAPFPNPPPISGGGGGLQAPLSRPKVNPPPCVIFRPVTNVSRPAKRHGGISGNDKPILTIKTPPKAKAAVGGLFARRANAPP